MLKTMLVDHTKRGTLAHSFRARRWSELLRCFPDVADMRVLDLGGTPASWSHAPVLPAQVVCVNLDANQASTDPRVTGLIADACELPDSLRSEHFDLVYSNSLMEHVGGHSRRQRFADAVHSSAGRHWVQTPYRYFPVEPHWLFPGMQWLPFRAKVAVAQYWPLGCPSRGARDRALEKVGEVELLSATEMRSYFPDSGIWFERLAGVPKSLVARKL